MQYFNPEYPEIVIHEHSSYVDPITGVQYPRNWDKTTIPGLVEYVPPPPPVESEEVVAAREKDSRNSERKQKILELERAQTQRLIREVLCGDESSKTRLAAIENEILAIRQALEA